MQSTSSEHPESITIAIIEDPEAREANRREVAETVKLLKGHKFTATDLCTACLRPGEGPRLQKCSRCKSAWYCSKECQKQNWSIHKQTCRSAEDSGLSHLINRFAANTLFWLYLQVYIILQLDMIKKPLPNTPFRAAVEVGIEPPDLRTFIEMYSGANKEYDNVEGMMQINAVSLVEYSVKPKYMAIWEHARREATADGFASDPVGLVAFLNEGSESGFVMSIRISSEAREIAKDAEPFIMTGGPGTYTKPFTAVGCIEWINRYIRQDRENKLRLRTRMKKGDIELIRDAGRNSDREVAQILRTKIRQEDVYKVHMVSFSAAAK